MDAGRRGRDRLEVALTFLRLGLTAFGGPAAHIALMEQEFVRRRRCALLAAAVCLGVLIRYRINSTWLVAAGAAAGLALGVHR